MLLDGSFIESTYVIEWLYFRIIGVMEGTFNKFDKFSTFKEKFRSFELCFFSSLALAWVIDILFEKLTLKIGDLI